MLSNLLIILGAIVILIIVLIRLYPLIRIFTARIVFGKYSARRINLYKKFTGKSPFAYCIKDDFINYIAGFYQKINSLDSFDTEQEITYSDIPFGASFGEVLNKNGKPLCVNAHRLETFDLKVIGYRETLFSTEIKSYYFFLNNRFFMGEYIFKETGNDKIAELAQILHKKYLGGLKAKSDNFLIRGANQSFIRFEHSGFYLSIKYLSRADQKIAEMLDQYWAITVKKPVDNISSFEEELHKRL